MRRDRNVAAAPEGMTRLQRLVVENIERRAGQFALVEQREQVGVDQMRAAPDVDDVRAVGEPRQRRAIQYADGVAGERQNRYQHVESRQEFVELIVADETADAGDLFAMARMAAHRKIKPG